MKVTTGTVVSSNSEGMYSKAVEDINIVSKTDKKGVILTVKDHPTKPKTSMQALKFWGEIYNFLKDKGHFE